MRAAPALLRLRLFASLAAVVWCAPPALAQEEPLTTPERTGYVETSRYADVIRFLDAIAGSAVVVDTFGYSYEGRALPVARWGEGPVRVLVFANIHAGEVEGKEAAQILLRELAGGEHAAWRPALSLWVAPIYNADGNERVSLTNRGPQLGPIGGMGQRPNAQGLDLNRDFMKLDAPESRSLVGLMTEIDPHVVIDLHTTNGSFHAYHLTYSPPLHPATDPAIDRYLRETWLPAVTEALAPEHRVYYYGNLPDAGVAGAEDSTAPRAWYTYDHRPRFSTNYVGLRNRFGILSEAYSYLSFEERIAVTLRFVVAVLDFAATHGDTIRAIAEGGDASRADSLPLTARPAVSSESIELWLGDVVEERHPFTGHVMFRAMDVVRPERMPEYGRFEGASLEHVPARYFVPAALAGVVDRLKAHGIVLQELATPAELEIEVFHITGSRQAEREYQGHRERTLEGAWRTERRRVPAGALAVPMDQPLARLAFLLLEPRSDDGLTAWGLMDAALEGAEEYPILRAAPVPASD